jgi:hypothetical protein
MEFRKDLRQLLVGYVDHRVPRADPIQLTIVEVQGRHEPHLKAQVGVETLRLVDHVGGQVDTDNVEPEIGQYARRRTGAAANVGDDTMAFH